MSWSYDDQDYVISLNDENEQLAEYDDDEYEPENEDQAEWELHELEICSNYHDSVGLEEHLEHFQGFWAIMSKFSNVVRKFHQQTTFNSCPWSYMSDDERFQNVVTAIESCISDILHQLEETNAATFRYPNLSSWENVTYHPQRGLLPVDHNVLFTSTSSRNKSSVRKFSIILLTLHKIWELCYTGSFSTKRDLYYQNVSDYESQAQVDSAVSVISAMLKIPRLQLRVLSTSKGLVAGDLTFTSAQGTLVSVQKALNGESVPQDVYGMNDVVSTAKFILVVEKDATFQKLLDEGYLNTFPASILITGRGIPDLNTRQLVHSLWRKLALPIFILVDADPFGIEIMCSYRFGSLSMVWTQEETAVPMARWIGIHPTDFPYIEEESQLMDLSNVDWTKINSLLLRPYLQHKDCSALRTQIERMKESGKKVEIQSFPSPLQFFVEKVSSNEWA